VLAHLHPQLLCAAEHLPGDGRRIGEAVGPATRRAEHVVHGEAADRGSVDALDRDAELALERAPLLELRKTVLGRRQEQVSDLAEEARAETGKELDALPFV